MQRFCFVAIICCLLVANCSCDEVNEVNERSNGWPSGPADIIGGVVEKDPRDPKYKRLSDESILKYLLEVGDFRYHKVLQVTRATEQIVSGTLTNVYFLAAPTNCLITGTVTPLNPTCRVACKDYIDLLACYSKIYDQPWTNKREITVSCSRINNRGN